MEWAESNFCVLDYIWTNDDERVVLFGCLTYFKWHKCDIFLIYSCCMCRSVLCIMTSARGCGREIVRPGGERVTHPSITGYLKRGPTISSRQTRYAVGRLPELSISFKKFCSIFFLCFKTFNLLSSKDKKQIFYTLFVRWSFILTRPLSTLMISRHRYLRPNNKKTIGISLSFR
jgi:hypothetical protein